MTITADLLTRLNAARATGAIPKPLPHEDLDSYAYRVALAGAVVGVHWHRAVLEAEDTTDRPGDDMGTSPGHPHDSTDDTGDDTPDEQSPGEIGSLTAIAGAAR